MSRPAEWGWIPFGCLLLILTYAATQRMGQADASTEAGSQSYESMAANALRGIPLQGEAPFVFRPGTPFLVAGFAWTREWVIRTGFARLNVAFNFLSVILLTLLLQRHVASRVARLVVLAAFMVEPHSPLRWPYFHPVSVDPALLAGLLTGLVAIEWFQNQPSVKRAAGLALLVAAGVAFHEAMLLIGVCVLCVPLGGTSVGDGFRRSAWRRRWESLEDHGAWLPLVSGVAALLAIHAWAMVTPAGAPASADEVGWFREISSLQYGVPWLLALASPVVYLLTANAPGRAPVVEKPARAARALSRWQTIAVVFLGTAAALAPVVWLATGGFYWRHYAEPGYGYLAYNLARSWTLVILLAAFWATGSRVLRFGSGTAADWKQRTPRFVESAFCGAAMWSVAVALLAMVHLYYVWTILPAVAVAVACAGYDLVAMHGAAQPAAREPAAPRWGLTGSLLRFFAIFNAAALLLTIALWGNPGPDNDVPGTYLGFYEQVLKAHSSEPNNFWVHFFVTKGNGLGFLVNILSDVEGAALASYLVLLLGAALIWRLAARDASVAPPIGLIGVCLYLQFYAQQGAYAKTHIIRNTLVMCLVLSFARFMVFARDGIRLEPVLRYCVIAAIILLSPLAVVLLIPILLVEVVFIWRSRDAVEAKGHLRYSIWAFAATALVCLYNVYEVGLVELHSMPSFMSPFVNLGRLGRWIDPGLAYVDDRLVFIQARLPGGEIANASTALKSTALSLAQVLPGMWNAATLALVGGTLIVGALGFACSRYSGPRDASARGEGTETSGVVGEGLWRGAAYLLVILAMVVGLRMIGGGAGSSMGRFTDFATPLGIALGVLLLNATWTLSMGRVQRGLLAVAISVVACLSMYLGAPPVLAQLWRPSLAFLLGENTYASMHDANWDTFAARAVAGSVPANARVEMLNFLPGFTSIPATPFQRPDGCDYLKDYTRVLYGSAEQAAAIYASVNTNYFLFEVSGQSPVVWPGFSALFSAESIRSRMRLVAHHTSAISNRDFYLLTWNRDAAPAGGAPFEAFLEKWGDLRAAERLNGPYRAGYDAGAGKLATSSEPVRGARPTIQGRRESTR